MQKRVMLTPVMLEQLECVVHLQPAVQKKNGGFRMTLKGWTENHAHGSCVKGHDECQLAARGHTEQATPPAPPLSVYPSSFEGSTAGGGTIESDHSRSPLNNRARR
jgi:hypothetical protein